MTKIKFIMVEPFVVNLFNGGFLFESSIYYIKAVRKCLMDMILYSMESPVSLKM